MSERERQFLELVRENRGRLRRIARVYAAGGADREDLHQEILLQLWRSLPSFEGASSPETWLYRVALNTALDHERTRERRRETRLDDEHPLHDRGFARPDRSYEERDRVERLRRAVERLDEGDRALVLLHLEGKSHGEISDVLGITENHAGVKLHRIRHRLAELLTEEEP